VIAHSAIELYAVPILYLKKIDLMAGGRQAYLLCHRRRKINRLFCDAYPTRDRFRIKSRPFEE